MRRIIYVIAVITLLAATVVGAADSGPNLEDKAVKKVTPVYPALAKRRRVEGKVTIKVQVGNDGSVSSAEFMEGNSLFKPASLEAAKQWVFQKSANGLNGHIVFKFILEEE